MLVRVTSDNHIRRHETFTRDVEESVESKLRRFAPQLTRVEVHLADENSSKHSDNDKTCTLEARLAGLQPLAATASGEQIGFELPFFFWASQYWPGGGFGTDRPDLIWRRMYPPIVWRSLNRTISLASPSTFPVPMPGKRSPLLLAQTIISCRTAG